MADDEAKGVSSRELEERRNLEKDIQAWNLPRPLASRARARDRREERPLELEQEPAA
jgi:hypothetical protein